MEVVAAHAAQPDAPRSVLFVDLRMAQALCRTTDGRSTWIDLRMHPAHSAVWRQIPDADLERIARATAARRQLAQAAA